MELFAHATASVTKDIENVLRKIEALAPDLSTSSPRSASWRKSTVYGLNGHRLYYIISLFKVTYKSTIQVSRNFHALFTKTLENSDTCD